MGTDGQKEEEEMDGGDVNNNRTTVNCGRGAHAPSSSSLTFAFPPLPSYTISAWPSHVYASVMAVTKCVVPGPQPEAATDTADDLPVCPISPRTSFQTLGLLASITPMETLDHVMCGRSVADRPPGGLTVPVEASRRCAGP
jgi:hypothetical protein